MIPEKSIILLSGIPATGKSTFGRYLSRKHQFAYYDLECHPRGWPHPEFKPTWDDSRSDFVAMLRRHHDRTALDWGFPPECLPWVNQLQAQGVRLIWFSGDLDCARRVFEQRGGIDPHRFDDQIRKIRDAEFPELLDCVVVEALPASGVFLDMTQIERIVFQRGD